MTKRHEKWMKEARARLTVLQGLVRQEPATVGRCIRVEDTVPVAQVRVARGKPPDPGTTLLVLTALWRDGTRGLKGGRPMKVCGVCGTEDVGGDGENVCRACGDLADARKAAELKKRRDARRMRDKAMRDLGMRKVRGNLGGTYWE